MRTVRYISGIPRKPLPPGHVVVHRPGEPRGWIAAPADDGGGYDVVHCNCGWEADRLAEHYRVKRGSSD
jgi:hypothetical protein